MNLRLRNSFSILIWLLFSLEDLTLSLNDLLHFHNDYIYGNLFPVNISNVSNGNNNTINIFVKFLIFNYIRINPL